jgi:hypothetical protein
MANPALVLQSSATIGWLDWLWLTWMVETTISGADDGCTSTTTARGLTSTTTARGLTS